MKIRKGERKKEAGRRERLRSEEKRQCRGRRGLSKETRKAKEEGLRRQKQGREWR